MMAKINDVLDAIQKIEALFQQHPKDSNREENEKELNRLAVEELRRLYDNIDRSFDNLRTKALALLAGEVTIVTFLISSSHKHPIFHGDVPIYGIVFYGLAILSFVIAFLIFVNVFSTVEWQHPPEEKDVQNITDRFNHRPLKFLEYLKDEYLECINRCGSIVSTKALRFMRGVYALLIGIFIMLMLIYGGGMIKI